MNEYASSGAWKAALLDSLSSPLLFATKILQATPEPWQIKALNLVAKHDRVAIRSGHGVGKTALLAWVALWFLLTRAPTCIPMVANSKDQLRDATWAELKRWVRRLPDDLRAQLDVGEQRITLADASEIGFIAARVGNRETPEALHGLHAEHMLFILEEASGIPDQVFEVAHGALSTEWAKVLMVSNPTRLSGYFYDAFHHPKVVTRWAKMHVNSEDVPRARGHIEDIIARFGKDSNTYRVRVLGEFPTTADEQAIPREWIDAAVTRDVKGTRFRPVWGLDVARFGDDRTALAKRRGNVLLEPVKWWRKKDSMQVAGLVVAEWKQTEVIDRPSEILVDVIGYGAGVCDRLFEQGLPARGVNVGEAASISDRFARLRDEVVFRCRDWFAAQDCLIPDDESLIAELSALTYTYSSSGKIIIESKGDMKARGLPSPDLADAFILTFAGGLDRLEDTKRRRYSGISIEQPSGWAA